MALFEELKLTVRYIGRTFRLSLDVPYSYRDKNHQSTAHRLFRCVFCHLDGGALYLVNCTSDPEICAENGVTGFPTLSAFRGLGWLEGNQCLTPAASMHTKYVRMDYHGPITVMKHSWMQISFFQGFFVKCFGQSSVRYCICLHNVLLLLQVKSIMEWFSQSASQAVTNIRFQDLDKHNMVIMVDSCVNRPYHHS